MTHIEEVAQDTYLVQAQISDLATAFSMYMIKEERSAVIDPGPAALVPVIQEAMAYLGLKVLDLVIPTHIHLDHGGAIGKLSTLMPGATIVVHTRGVRHVVDPSQLIESTRAAFGRQFEAVYGPILPVPESRLRIVEDGDKLELGSRELEVFYTPGHAPHHIALFDRKTKGLFSGEALGLIYQPGAPPLPAVAPPSLDLEGYLADMERLRKLSPAIIFYAHGGVGREPERLIPQVIENTKLVAEATLNALRVEKTDRDAIKRVGEYIRDHLGVTMEKRDLFMNIQGFIAYYRKRGLV